MSLSKSDNNQFAITDIDITTLDQDKFIDGDNSEDNLYNYNKSIIKHICNSIIGCSYYLKTNNNSKFKQYNYHVISL